MRAVVRHLSWATWGTASPAPRSGSGLVDQAQEPVPGRAGRIRRGWSTSRRWWRGRPAGDCAAQPPTGWTTSQRQHLGIRARTPRRQEAIRALVFGGEEAGVPMRSRTLQRAVFDRAAEAVGLDGLTPQRCAIPLPSWRSPQPTSRLFSRCVGHESATTTLDLHGHLFPDRLDTVVDAMDTARIVALEASGTCWDETQRDVITFLPLSR